MLKRLSRVLLFGGLLGLVPASAQAAPVTPAEVVPPDASPAAGYELFQATTATIATTEEE